MYVFLAISFRELCRPPSSSPEHPGDKTTDPEHQRPDPTNPTAQKRQGLYVRNVFERADQQYWVEVDSRAGEEEQGNRYKGLKAKGKAIVGIL